MLQFYPSSDDQITLITSIARKAGFGGGLVVDFPNSKKARKVFLCLMVGGGSGTGATAQQLPQGLQGDGEDAGDTAAFERRRARDVRRKSDKGKRKGAKDRDWILKKKEVSRTFVCLNYS